MKIKRHPNTKDLLNRVLLSLTGSKALVALWWKSPNKGLKGATPISLWKGSVFDKKLVTMYVWQSATQEGS